MNPMGIGETPETRSHRGQPRGRGEMLGSNPPSLEGLSPVNPGEIRLSQTPGSLGTQELAFLWMHFTWLELRSDDRSLIRGNWHDMMALRVPVAGLSSMLFQSQLGGPDFFRARFFSFVQMCRRVDSGFSCWLSRLRAADGIHPLTRVNLDEAIIGEAENDCNPL